MSRIATAIGEVKSVLEKNYPDATVKSAEPGECDARVGHVGATITVNTNGLELTDSDIQDMKNAVDSAIDDRHLVNKGNRNDGSVMLDLKS